MTNLFRHLRSLFREVSFLDIRRIRQHQVRISHKQPTFPCLTSTVEDDDNQTTDSNETDSEPIFDEEDVKGFEEDPDKDLDDEKNLFVSFDDMEFCVLGPNSSSSEF